MILSTLVTWLFMLVLTRPIVFPEMSGVTLLTLRMRLMLTICRRNVFMCEVPFGATLYNVRLSDLGRIR